MKTATLVKELKGWRSNARLYRLSEPMVYYSLGPDERKMETRHVVVSAVVAMDTMQPETFIFPAKSNGTVINYMELEGSFQGGWDHEKALSNAGYDVVLPAEQRPRKKSGRKAKT